MSKDKSIQLKQSRSGITAGGVGCGALVALIIGLIASALIEHNSSGKIYVGQGLNPQALATLIPYTLIGVGVFGLIIGLLLFIFQELPDKWRTRRGFHRAAQMFDEIEEWTLTMLIAKLEDGDPYIRAGAIRRIGEKSDAERLSHLVGSVDDSHFLVRERVAIALANQKSPAGVDALIVLLDDPDEKVVEVTITGLIAQSDPRAIEPLSKLFLKENFMRDNLASLSADAMIQINDEKARDFFRGALAHQNDSIQAHAMKILCELKDKRAVKEICMLLEKVDSPNKIKLIQALGDIGDTRALPALEPFLSSKVDQLRNVSKTAIKNIQTIAEQE